MARKPFDLMDSVPAALHGLILDFEWSRERLWALDLGEPVATTCVRSDG